MIVMSINEGQRIYDLLPPIRGNAESASSGVLGPLINDQLGLNLITDQSALVQQLHQPKQQCR